MMFSDSPLPNVFPTLRSESFTAVIQDSLSALDNAATSRHEEVMTQLRTNHQEILAVLQQVKGRMK